MLSHNISYLQNSGRMHQRDLVLCLWLCLCLRRSQHRRRASNIFSLKRIRELLHRHVKLLPHCRGWKRLPKLFLSVGICCYRCNHCQRRCCGTHQDPGILSLFVCYHFIYLPGGCPLGMVCRWFHVQLARRCGNRAIDPKVRESHRFCWLRRRASYWWHLRTRWCYFHWAAHRPFPG